MIARRILRGTILLVAGVAVAGCSQGKMWSPTALLKSQPSDLSMASAPRGVDRGGSLSRDPADSAIRGPLAMARLNERHGEMEQAERLYQAMVKKSPRDPAPYHRLGVIRAREGNFQEADEYFARALQIDPTNTVLLSDVGYLYYLQDRPEEAEAVLRKALELKPSDPTICNNLAMLLGEQGRDREALAMFKRAGTEAQAYANLAFVYTQRCEFEKAEESYSRALTLDRDLRPAAEALTQLAEYKELADRSPTHAWAPDPETLVASRAAPEPPAAQPETREVEAQQATYLAGEASPGLYDESSAGMAGATDLPEPASLEEDAPSAEAESRSARDVFEALARPADAR